MDEMQRQPRPLRGSLPRHQVGLESADDDRGIIQLLLEDERLSWGSGSWSHQQGHQGSFKINTQAFQETGPGEPGIVCPTLGVHPQNQCPWSFPRPTGHSPLPTLPTAAQAHPE